MKRLTLLAMLCCIYVSHAFADGFIETNEFTFSAHKHNAKSNSEKWQELSNGGKVPVEAYVHARYKTLSGSIKIPTTAKYEYTYWVNNPNTGTKESRTGTYELKVTGIGNFSSCTKITNVKLNEYIIEISSNAFSGCESLANVDMSDATSLDSIAGGAFYNCAIKELTMPNSLRIIDGGAFQNCKSLETIHVSQNLVRIGGGAFQWCSELEHILFDKMEAGKTSKLALIEKNAFKECKNKLVKAVFPCPELDSIGEMTFWGCTALKLCDLSETKITKVPEEAFVECNQVREVVVTVNDKGNKSSRRRANSGEVTGILLPSTVTSIGEKAFSGCAGLTDVDLSSVKEIGTQAFKECAGINSINMPMVQSIGGAAFYKCAGLTKIDLPYVNEIGISAFRGCSSLKSTNLVSVQNVGNSAFSQCTELSSVDMPMVQNIGSNAFYDCSKLKSIDLPKVKAIGDNAFESCDNLSSIKLPSVESIGDYAFGYCYNLSSVNLSSEVKSIGFEAFEGTSWIRNLPNGLNYIGKIAFRYVGDMPQNTTIDIKEGTIGIAGGCFEEDLGRWLGINLVGINIPESVTEIGACAFRDCGLHEIHLPQGLSEIKESTFSGCSNLKEIKIPEQVTNIGVCAFSGCSNLREVEIPELVKSIGERAFDGCTALKDIYDWAETPQAFNRYYGNSTFSDYNATLHVPVGCKEAYEQAEVWKNFANIVEENKEQFQLLRRYDALLADAKAALAAASSGSQEGTPLIKSVSQLSSPYTETIEGSLAGLLDGNTSTFWHSAWSAGSVPGGTHYLQIDLVNPADMEVYAQFTRRPAMNDHVTNMSVLGTNDFSAGKSACEELLTFACPYGSNTETITSPNFRTKGNRYLRFYANETTTGRGYWHISEFQLYSVTTQGAPIEQMEEEAAALQAVIDAQSQMDRSDIGEEEYNALKEAYDAFMAKLAEVTDAVIGIQQDGAGQIASGVVYDLSGRRLAKMQKGINVVRMSDGTTKKVLVK